MLLDIISSLIAAIGAMNGQVDTLAMTDNYARYRMADSCYVETLNYGDSTLVIETVCAPLCSSRAYVYYNKESDKNKSNKKSRSGERPVSIVPSPYPSNVLVKAGIENGKIVWTVSDSPDDYSL